MKEILLWGLLFIFMVYTVLPRIIIDFFGFRAFKKGHVRNEIAFTFDDGPDPLYTPRLLDLLKKYRIKATFFIVGSKAEKFPGLILRMHQEGHLIGIHNYVHKPHCLMTPWKVQRQIDHSADIVERITGVRPVYYRPPWGLPNLFDVLSRRKFRMVLWSLMVGDWKSRGGKEKIKRRLLTHITEGDVIVLHDCGDTFGADLNAPSHMIKALEDVLKVLKVQGYQCVRIDEMIRNDQKQIREQLSWSKRLLIASWLKWERLFRKIFQINPIDRKNKLLTVRIRKYHGKTIRLENGEEIRKGDPIAELHFNNELLFKMREQTRSSVQLAIQIIRSTEHLLPEIAQFILNNQNYKDIKGVYGISIINRGAEKLGFTVIDLPKGVLSYFIRLYLRFLLWVLHPQGKKRLELKKDLLIPKIIVMSTKQLIENTRLKIS